MTDFQRQRVYDAEGIMHGMFDHTVANDNPVVQVKGITLTLPPEARFASVESVQAYVDRVMRMPAVLDRFGVTPPITVRRRKGQKMAHYEPQRQVIAVPDTLGSWAMREIVVLHEMAHHYAPASGHGPEFTATFRDLLGIVMGVEVALLLRVLFDGEGVKQGGSARVAASSRVS